MPDRRTESLCTHVEASLYRRVKQLAEQEDRSISSLLRHRLRKIVDEDETPVPA